MKKSSIVTALSMITQFGISVITPPILCILAAMWLQSRFNIGDWIMITGILLGTASGVTSMINTIRYMSKEANKEEDSDA